LAFTWTPAKNAKSLELFGADEITFDILAPKPKGTPKTAKPPCVGTVNITWADVNALTVGGSPLVRTSGGCTISITLKSVTNYQGYDIPTIEIKVSGLEAATKYTVEMQVKYGTQYSKVAKVSATTAKYAAPKVKKPTYDGTTVKLEWAKSVTETKGQITMPPGATVVYEVGVYNASTKTYLFGTDVPSTFTIAEPSGDLTKSLNAPLGKNALGVRAVVLNADGSLFVKSAIVKVSINVKG
jgi:hypothetical protein